MLLPSPQVIDDLIVEEYDGGLLLSAKDNTECAAWLAHYNETEELRKEFEEWFVGILQDRLEELQQNGNEN